MEEKAPGHWAYLSDPEWTTSKCAICGRKAKGPTKFGIKCLIDDNSVMSDEGEQVLHVGAECTKQIPEWARW